MKKVIFFAIMLLFLTSLADAGIYLGITDGYIKDVDGNLISGANVSLTLSGCSGGGCSGSTLSESTGYYVIYNLNLAPGGAVSVSAMNGGGSGSSSGLADSYQVAHINITICYPPSAPTLTPVADAHNQTFTFTWTSGIDPNLKPKYDQFKLDSENFYNADSPLNRTSITFASHTWKARTCNNYCCSGEPSDTFTATNNAPTVPNNTNATDIGNNLTNLAWTSGTDIDGDLTYDEVQWNGTLYSSVVSPFNVTTELLIEWKVRTCDAYNLCSAWVDMSSIMCGAANLTCPSCPECICGGGGGCGGTVTYEMPKTKIYCNGILYAEDYLVSVSMDTRGKRVSLVGTNQSLQGLDLKHCMWCTDGKKNGDETEVDCGGSCAPCGGPPGQQEKPFAAPIPFTKMPLVAEIPQVKQAIAVIPGSAVNNAILAILCTSIALIWYIFRLVAKRMSKFKFKR